LYGSFESYTVALGWQLASTGMHSPVAVNLTGHKTLLNEPLMYHQTLQQSISAPSELAVSWKRHILRRLRIDHISSERARQDSPNKSIARVQDSHRICSYCCTSSVYNLSFISLSSMPHSLIQFSFSMSRCSFSFVILFPKFRPHLQHSISSGKRAYALL
jgi:hypothetical protein